MNLNKYLIVFLVGLSPFIAYGQTYPLLSTYEGDTVLIFSIEQGRYLTKSNEERKYFENLVRECEQEISVHKEVTSNQDSVITNLQLVIDDYIIIVRTKEELIDICEIEKELLNDEVKKQKRHKWVAIISGSILTVLSLLIAL